jgi:hypothetical protein
MRIGRRSLLLAAASCGASTAFADPAPPHTLIEFLQAMKRAGEEGALLDATFYDEANLKRLFAARGVTFGMAVEGYRLYGTVWGFGPLVEAVRVVGTVREGMTLQFGLQPAQPGPAAGHLQLSFLRPSLPFDQIEQIFGRNWEPGTYPPPPDGAIPHAERAHGSTAIRYRLGSGPPARWMDFAFSSRALVEAATVWVR